MPLVEDGRQLPLTPARNVADQTVKEGVVLPPLGVDRIHRSDSSRSLIPRRRNLSQPERARARRAGLGPAGGSGTVCCRPLSPGVRTGRGWLITTSSGAVQPVTHERDADDGLRSWKPSGAGRGSRLTRVLSSERREAQ
ncbi:hypothetical protein SCWH03_57450 [Streptomyces pacificus]|uniref:Uncharacterized protein n=1 Tax=Streptomyces pacificus TaxID=2705029 RepID=A0A6A0B6V8_9ACTN|nr:hypothetical protein SCWH03_57450 [Streptomyces pacificus]